MIAYAALVSGEASRVFDLLRMIYSSENEIYFHVDEKSPASTKRIVDAACLKFSNVKQVKPTRCSWGGYSLVAAELELIQKALEVSYRWDKLIFVSESHVPLFEQNDLLARFDDNISASEAVRVGDMSRPALVDEITTRQNLFYRELPGLGSFACFTREPGRGWIADVYHGSQWIALSRAMAEEIAMQASHTGDLEIFRGSIIPDENALQTVMMSPIVRGNHPINRINPTGVAYTKPGLIFDRDSFTAARNYGHAFVRKRPLKDEDWLAQYIESISSFSPDAMREALAIDFQECDEQIHARSGSEAAEMLKDKLSLTHGFIVRVIERSASSLHLRIDSDGSNAVSFHIMSGDPAHVKFCVVLDEPFEAHRFAPSLWKGFPTYVLQVRQRDIFLKREIIFNADGKNGFFRIFSEQQASEVAQVISEQIRELTTLNR